MSIRNIAAEHHIRSVLIANGCQPIDVRPQSDYYLVSFSHLGGSRALKVANAQELREILEKESIG